MRRTQNLEIVYLYSSKFPHLCVGKFCEKFSTASRPRLLFRGKEPALPLYYIAAARKNLTRELASLKIALKHTLVFARLLFV